MSLLFNIWLRYSFKVRNLYIEVIFYYKMKWGDTEIDYLIKNYSTTIPISGLTSKLQKTRRAILHKAARLGLSRIHAPINKPKDPLYRQKIDRLYYLKNKNKIYARKMERRKRIKENMIKIFGGRCNNCDYNKSIAALDFHHKNNDKEHNIADLIKNSSEQSVFKEANKCIILCANCHRETHSQGP